MKMAHYFKFTVVFFCITALLPACCSKELSSAHLSKYQTAIISLPSGDTFLAYIANTPEQQRLGLSQIKDGDFDLTRGMLFPKEEIQIRQFWMPETYFDLDVIFMNENYTITDIHRALEHYPFKAKKGEVPMSKKVLSQHVLEVKSYSDLANKLQIGMKLTLNPE